MAPIDDTRVAALVLAPCTSTHWCSVAADGFSPIGGTFTIAPLSGDVSTDSMPRSHTHEDNPTIVNVEPSKHSLLRLRSRTHVDMLNCQPYVLFRITRLHQESDLRSMVSPSLEGETIARIRYPAGVRAGSGASPRSSADHNAHGWSILRLGRASFCHSLLVARVVIHLVNLVERIFWPLGPPLDADKLSKRVRFPYRGRLQPRCAARYQRPSV